MSHTMLRLGFAGFALVSASMAHAEDDNRFYGGLRAGDELNDRYTQSNFADDAARGGYAGWRFRDHWGIEASYSDLGQFRSRASGPDHGSDGEADLWTVGATYRFPVAERFDVFAGIGWFELNEEINETTIAGTMHFKNTEAGGYAEVGGRFDFNDALALRVSYQWFDIPAFGSDGDGTPWLGLEAGF
jgi:hypothetical protein